METKTSNENQDACAGLAATTGYTAFRKLVQELNDWKRREYPIGCIVRVGENYGLASAEDGCPPDKLPVRFENNNVWWKPLETISRVTDLKAIPPWVRRMKLRWAGYAV